MVAAESVDLQHVAAKKPQGGSKDEDRLEREALHIEECSDADNSLAEGDD
jgi:hypothetical protein